MDFSPHGSAVITEMGAADAFVSPVWRAGGSLEKPLKVGELPCKQGPWTNAGMKKCPISKPGWWCLPAHQDLQITVHTGEKWCILCTGFSYRNAGLWYLFGQSMH